LRDSGLPTHATSSITAPHTVNARFTRDDHTARFSAFPPAPKATLHFSLFTFHFSLFTFDF
jgi:hypothetical protein